LDTGSVIVPDIALDFQEKETHILRLIPTAFSVLYFQIQITFAHISTKQYKYLIVEILPAAAMERAMFRDLT
jgi:hypothetical protein